MSADHTIAALLFGHFTEFLFIIGNEGNSLFYFLFHHLREGIVREAALDAVLIVVPVQPKQESIADVAQFGDPFQVCGYGVKDVSMHHEIFSVAGLMNVLSNDGEIAELEGQYFIQEVIVITAEIDHFCFTCCQPLHDQFEKCGVFFLPFAGFAELPSVYDIAVEDERITGVAAEEMDGFFNPGILYTEVNIGHDNGTIVRLQWFGVSQN
jgi:hypothetical protein